MEINEIKKIIPNSENWTKSKQITFGWSGEQKFKITTEDGKTLLLRLLSFEQKEKQEKGIAFLEKCNKTIENTSILLDKGNTLNNNNYYLLLNWIDGEDGMKAIEKLSTTEQYNLGIKMGKTIKKLHSLTTPIFDPTPNEYISTNIIEYIAGCREYLTNYAPLQTLTTRIERDLELINNRPMIMLHNDFHLGNMVINGRDINLIDFNRARLGDNIKEFDCIAWSATHSIPFSVGLLDEYLRGEENIQEFFKLHRLYVTIWQVQMLYFIKEETEEEKKIVTDLINFTNTWYDGDSNIPNWYIKNNKLGIR